jgi:hypothetical protein
MAVTAHVFPKLTENMGKKLINLSTDTLDVLLIASGTYTWGATPEGQSFVSDFLGGDGSHGALTEVSTSGTGYTRQALASVSFTSSGLVTTLTCANPSWANATLAANYALFYDGTPATDAGRFLMCYWDLGGSQTVTGATLTLTINASGLITWTSS